MTKELNDTLLREAELASLLSYFRGAKVPDGLLTDERRHSIVMSLKEERDAMWLKIRDLCDAKPESDS